MGTHSGERGVVDYGYWGMAAQHPGRLRAQSPAPLRLRLRAGNRIVELRRRDRTDGSAGRTILAEGASRNSAA